MSARILGCMLVLLMLLVASAVLAEGTWYGLREQYAVEKTQATERSGQVERVEEIEVAPGVRVRADIWDDDYVPTYEDLFSVGFMPDDAGDIVSNDITWGEIKACFSKPDPAKCLSKKNDEG
jgi:hypothetical protein